MVVVWLGAGSDGHSFVVRSYRKINPSVKAGCTGKSFECVGVGATYMIVLTIFSLFASPSLNLSPKPTATARTCIETFSGHPCRIYPYTSTYTFDNNRNIVSLSLFGVPYNITSILGTTISTYV